MLDETLGSSEELDRKLQLLLKQLPAVLWTTDQELRFTSSSGAGLGRLNLLSQQVNGMSLFEFFRTEDSQFPPIQTHLAALEGHSSTFEQDWLGSSFRCYVEPLRNDRGEIVGCLGLALDITEMKLAEASLRESESRLRQVIDLVPHLIFAKNSEGRLLLVNRAMAEAYGTTAEKLTGRYHQDVHRVPGELLHYLRDDQQVIHSGKPKFIPEETFVDAEGCTRWMQTTKIPFLLEGGREKAMLGVAVDITELKQQQQALHVSERRFQALAESAPVGILVADQKGLMVYANLCWRQLANCNLEQTLGEGWTRSIHPEDREDVVSSWRTAVTAVQDWAYEFRVQSAEGQLRWVLARAVAERNDQDQPLSFIATVTDITERKSAEGLLQSNQARLHQQFADQSLKLSDSQARLEAESTERSLALEALLREQQYNAHIVHSAPTLIVNLDRNGFTRAINPAVTKVLGYTEVELLGKNWWPLIYPGEDYRQVEQLYIDFKSGPVSNYDMVATAKDGTKRTISWSSINRYETNGTISEIIGIGMDVTDRRKMEHAVRERQQVLRQMLDAYERDRRLISMEMHDGLIQHMTGAVMQLQAAHHKVKSAPERALEQNQQALEMLRECIAEARRLMSGLRPPVLDEEGVVSAVRFLVAELRKDVSQVAFQNQTTFERLAAPLENTLFRIAQEAMNNIRRHSQATSASIMLTETEHEISLSVADDGIGFKLRDVPPDHFGLKGIRERTELLGGTARIDSAPGKGTTISVCLPKIDALE